MSKIVHKSACPLNCWDSCGFEVTVEDDKVIKIDGDQDHPITEGKICGRGRMLEAKTNSVDRLLHPMKKVDGVFQQISWNQALDEISQKMSRIRDEYGPTAVLHSHDYANSGLLKNLDKRFFNCYGGVTELIGSICWGAGIEAQSWDFGSSYSHAPDDIYHSKHVVVWGRNVARTNMHLFHHLQEIKKRGTTITVIDPIFNATAKIADRYISLKPGMDGWLALGIMKLLVHEGLEDQKFIKKHTIGYEDLLDLMQSISIEEIIEKTEVSMEDFIVLRDIYKDRPVSTLMGLGMQRYSNGGNTIRLIDALVSISGNIGIRGGGANFGNLQVGQSFHMKQLTLPERKVESRQFTMMKQAESILNAKNPEIKMIFVTCGNPLTQVPDSNRVINAFKSVDTLVVVDHFLTDTAEMADYVLPTTTVFEEDDIYYASMYHHYMNYGEKLVEPQGEAKSDRWIWTELAKRLGFGEEFDYSNDEFLRMGLHDLEKHGLTLERLKREKRLPLPVDHVPWENKTFLTPSGKYEFTAAAAAKKGYDGLLKLSLPSESRFLNPSLSEKYPYNLLSIHPMRSNHSQHYPIIESLQKVKIEISADIALEKGILENDKVVIFNNRGRLEGIAKLFKKAHPKTINVDEGQWHKFGGTVNLLTPDGESDNGLGSVLYDCLVNIEIQK